MNIKNVAMVNLPDNLSMRMLCPCSKKFRRWRSSFYRNADYEYPIDADTVGFKECQSGEFTDFVEFFKHIKDFEKNCYYHSALIDIINILYPGLYTLVIDGRKCKKIKSYQTKKTKVGKILSESISPFTHFSLVR